MSTSPDRFNESEVLLTGIRSGFDVRNVPPAAEKIEPTSEDYKFPDE